MAKVQVTLEFGSEEEMVLYFGAKLTQEPVAAAAAPKSERVNNLPPKRGRPKKSAVENAPEPPADAPEPEQPESELPQGNAVEMGLPDIKEKESYTDEDVRNALQNVVAAKGMVEARKVLTGFKTDSGQVVDRISALPAGQYAVFIAACKKVTG